MMKEVNYKELRSELDDIIEQVQNSGADDIDKSIELYNRAKTIIAELKEYLETAQNKLTKNKK